jgi:serine/threonine-protein kinase RsbW/stage II sporulation protein AB (anti-sigma F factor)
VTAVAETLVLRYEAVPEAVGAVRQAVVGFAQARGGNAEVCSAVALAVSEAATNAVVHAYADAKRPGPLIVTAETADDMLTIVVADHGRGMRPRPDSPGLGLGLPLTAQVTAALEVRHNEHGGTDVYMRFALGQTAAL